MTFKLYPARDPVPGPGPGGYLPDPAVADAVNAALAARQPLLVMGEPGVGKTDLAASVHWHLSKTKAWEFEKFSVRSDSRGRDALYRYDHLQRLFDAQVVSAARDLGGETIQKARARFADPRSYVRYQALGKAFTSGKPTVVLIDEVDKAPRDFANDLLNEIDTRDVSSDDKTGQTVGDLVVEEVPDAAFPGSAAKRFVVFTTNRERDLPEAFLRRCVMVRIPFPTLDRLEQIVLHRTKGTPVGEELARAATRSFWDVRGRLPERDWRKIPSIGELLRWVTVLAAAGKAAADVSERADLVNLFPGVLIKSLDDAERLSLPL